MSLNHNDYDVIIVFFSGGKDSLACLLHLVELDVDLTKVELWHHEIDGREGSTLMDWPCTPSYCRAVANAFGTPIYYSWRVGGFEREMLRDNTPTAPTRFETPSGEIIQAGGRGPVGTRLKFPQVSGDLRVRWCSAYLKIDVGRIAIANQPRFKGIKTLVISGERAEESPNRARYKTFERENHQANRHVDRWRPIHAWKQAEVWAIIERFRVNPHPAYRLGWGRVSCRRCIFGSHNQWASLHQIEPEGVQPIALYEQQFGYTIHRTMSVMDRVQLGTPYTDMQQADIAAALSTEFNEPIILAPGQWVLPAGAFGESCGPT